MSTRWLTNFNVDEYDSTNGHFISKKIDDEFLSKLSSYGNKISKNNRTFIITFCKKRDNSSEYVDEYDYIMTLETMYFYSIFKETIKLD